MTIKGFGKQWHHFSLKNLRQVVGAQSKMRTQEPRTGTKDSRNSGTGTQNPGSDSQGLGLKTLKPVGTGQ